MIEIRGRVDDGFGAVADAFRANFDEHDEVGAGFCLYVDGKPGVDITGGVADAATGRAYDDSTLQLVFSTTKGAAAICAAILFEEGRLDYDEPVSTYWPEFAAAGKADVPVRWVMSHQAGLAAIDDPPPLDDVLAVDPVVAALAAATPLWEPGTAHGYHTLAYGWLVAEIVHRITGQRLNEFLQERVAAPLGVEFWIGLPDEQHHRVAPLVSADVPQDAVSQAMREQFFGPETLIYRCLTLDGRLDLLDAENAYNTRAVMASEIPAANGVTNASSLARMYAATIGDVDGVRLFDDATREVVATPVTTGPDQCLMVETKFSMGFATPDGLQALGGPRSFGHSGAGGSLGYADPDLGIGYGYVMNHMTAAIIGDPRTQGLSDAVKACLS